MSSSNEKHQMYGIPDFDTKFITDDELRQFEKALHTPDVLPLVAINDWRPIYQRVRQETKRRSAARRSVDETREGFVYSLLKWPLLGLSFFCLGVCSVVYLLVRYYIHLYEHYITWTGKRHRLRRALINTTTYDEWKEAAQNMDDYLGNSRWKEIDKYSYYDHATVDKVTGQLKRLRTQVERTRDNSSKKEMLEEIRSLLEGCVKNNFAGVENSRLYSETYLGTKDLVQDYIDEVHTCLRLLLDSEHVSDETKFTFSRHLDTNFGRTALCLSGGATFSYYHFGVIKALLDNEVLPQIISGTSGGALVAALVATRTDEELKKLLVPELAHKIKACEDPFTTWAKRWWETGARFDTMDWAEKCSWFCRGSTTFKEAYERTGRILNVSCVPSDPHSPTILANYLTSPNCVIWSAVIASAAVPGILNPVVLMMKKPDGTLAPYSFGHKWKDGSLRTDIPLKALNVHFNVNFPVVSQVNPHISLFFFNSRGSVGRPVTHRKGRGWRGGFLGSVLEVYLKLELNKWLKFLKIVELLPRPLGQDWSQIWLQRFNGTVTIWPRSVPSDLYYILTDPTEERLARMLREGQQRTFPKIRFIQNRMKLENVISEGLRRDPSLVTRSEHTPLPSKARASVGGEEDGVDGAQRPVDLLSDRSNGLHPEHATRGKGKEPSSSRRRLSNGVFTEIRRQSAVFFDDTDDTFPSEDENVGAGDERGTKVG